MFYVLFVLYLILTCAGLLLIKQGGQATHMEIVNSLFSMQMDVKLILGLFSYVLSFLLYTVILQKKDLSYIYPLSAGIVNVVSVIMGVFILKEKMEITGIIGTIMIIIGVILLNVRG